MKKYVKSSTYGQRVFDRAMESRVSEDQVVDFFIQQTLMLMKDVNLKLDDALYEVVSSVVPDVESQVSTFIYQYLADEEGYLSPE